MTTRRTVLRKMPVAALFVVAAGWAVSCRLGKKDELEDRPLPEPLPVSEAGSRAKTPAASPGAALPARTVPSQPKNAPGHPAASQPAPASQTQGSLLDAATAADAGHETTAEAGAPAPGAATIPSASPARMAKCLEKCNALLGACVKRLTQSDAGTPSAETIASCTQAESDCRAACQ